MKKRPVTTDRRCYIEDSMGGEDSCVLDSGSASDCDEAVDLVQRGLCKADCSYWRHPESVASTQQRIVQQRKAKALIRIDASNAKTAAVQSNLNLDMDLAAGAPTFKGSFGHGAFYRK